LFLSREVGLNFNYRIAIKKGALREGVSLHPRPPRSLSCDCYALISGSL
jgi:hypothetical protein